MNFDSIDFSFDALWLFILFSRQKHNRKLPSKISHPTAENTSKKTYWTNVFFIYRILSPIESISLHGVCLVLAYGVTARYGVTCTNKSWVKGKRGPSLLRELIQLKSICLRTPRSPVQGATRYLRVNHYKITI